MTRKKKSFKELSPPQRAGAVVSMVISLALVISAERDLHRRPEEEIRGDKRLWRVLCLNAVGALGYFLLGRRPA